MKDQGLENFQYHWLGGHLERPPIRGSSAKNALNVYDLASLTKVICTSSLLGRLFVEGSQSWSDFLHQPVSEFVPELVGSALQNTKLVELWEHRSGLRAHALVLGGREARFPLEDRQKMWSELLSFLRNEIVGKPVGTLYSDLGFLLLGVYLERRLGKNLDQAFREWKDWAELDAPSLGFLSKNLSHLVPTEERHPAGEVNDDNAQAMGGVAPHAGLFGSVDDVWAYLQALLKISRRHVKSLAWLDSRFALHSQRRFHAGWDRPVLVYDPVTAQQLGREFQTGLVDSPSVIGHLGFTGTAFWWDFQSMRAGVLLSNRVWPAHHEKNQQQIKTLRHRFFTALWQGKLNSQWQ